MQAERSSGSDGGFRPRWSARRRKLKPVPLSGSKAVDCLDETERCDLLQVLARDSAVVKASRDRVGEW